LRGAAQLRQNHLADDRLDQEEDEGADEQSDGKNWQGHGDHLHAKGVSFRGDPKGKDPKGDPNIQLGEQKRTDERGRDLRACPVGSTSWIITFVSSKKTTKVENGLGAVTNGK